MVGPAPPSARFGTMTSLSRAAVRPYDLVYAAGSLLMSPAIVYRLLRTGEWRTDWQGRFGIREPLPPDPRPTVLIHGVSLGEINATRRLVEHLEQEHCPLLRVVISSTTDTGMDRATALYAALHPVVRYPLDFSWMVRRFLDATRPDLIALVELELWPNLAAECGHRGIPLCVINGRLSDESFPRYRRARPLVRSTFRRLSAVAAQTEEYAQRFVALGVPPDRVTVTDNMKWDTVSIVDEVPGAAALASALGIDRRRPLVVAGSTGPGEEAILIRTRPDGVQLLLAPRQPERFDAVAGLLPGIVRRTQRPDGSSPAGEGADVFLLDTTGELSKAYALSDVAIVGRSFAVRGGSDPIEPLALGRPTIMGPYYENFVDVVDSFQQAQSIVIAPDPMGAAQDLLANPSLAREMGRRGHQLVRQRQGASRRHVQLLLRILRESGRLDSPEAGDSYSTRPPRGPAEEC